VDPADAKLEAERRTRQLAALHLRWRSCAMAP
jgi:hypothetical protein